MTKVAPSSRLPASPSSHTVHHEPTPNRKRPRPWSQRVVDYIDSFHGVEAGHSHSKGAITKTSSNDKSESQDVSSSSSSASHQENREITELDIWRMRCLIVVAWSCGSTGAGLVPLYFIAGAWPLGTVLLLGSLLLLATPWLTTNASATMSIRLSKEAAARAAGTLRGKPLSPVWLSVRRVGRRIQVTLRSPQTAHRIVAYTAVIVMTILTVGSGGFPNGLAPGIQRILPILVLSFGSLQLGATVTVYVMLETLILHAMGPLPAVLDDRIMLETIMLGSWVSQTMILFCLGVSLQAAQSQTVQQLRAVSKVKTRFLSIVSHELRTPLHGIMGSCDLVTTSKDLNECQDAIHSCQLAAIHLSNIVEDLLLYSSSAAIRIQSKPCSVRHLISKTSATLLPMSITQSCDLQYQVSHDVRDAWFLGDEVRLAQCIINVAGNALKFCRPDDCITISISLRPQRISNGDFQREKSPSVIMDLIIADTGPGIPKADVERIFIPFEQAEGLESRSLAGVGLGLSIVSELLHKMKGSVRCESTVGKGTTFFMTVPVTRSSVPVVPTSRRGSRVVASTDETCTELESSVSSAATPSLLLEQITDKPACATSIESSVPTPERENSRGDPIVFATIASHNLEFLETWQGEEGIFETIQEWDTWDDLMQAMKDAGPENTVDVILFDDSFAAADAALRHRSQGFNMAVSIPFIQLKEGDKGNRFNTEPGDCANEPSSQQSTREGEDCSHLCFDASVHPLLFTSMARSWYRSLVLGAWILVVDDVALNRKVLAKQLSRLGHHVSTAKDGLEACQVVKAAGYGHDMIAMDLMMPVMDGKTAAMRILEEERKIRGDSGRLCPIFCVTAAETSVLDDCTCFAGHLKKPTTVKQLRSMVRYQVIRRMLPFGPASQQV